MPLDISLVDQGAVGRAIGVSLGRKAEFLRPDDRSVVGVLVPNLQKRSTNDPRRYGSRLQLLTGRRDHVRVRKATAGARLVVNNAATMPVARTPVAALNVIFIDVAPGDFRGLLLSWTRMSEDACHFAAICAGTSMPYAKASRSVCFAR
jgi:hypothetical protein